LPANRGEKRPTVGQWKRYRERLPTEAELSAWFANGPDAVCIVCGAVSGNAEMIDFDAGGELFDAWAGRIAPELLARLAVETSRSGGRHVFYRCEAPVCGNMKLAQRRTGDKTVTLIETRGEGGLFLCTPTAGYEAVQGDLGSPPLLTEAERDALLAAAWELNEYVPEPVGETRRTEGRQAVSPVPQGAMQGERPGDDFNRRGDVRALLERAGWVLAREGENEYWRRPGKSAGWSASLKDRVFYVFSANASPFEANRAYAPFSVYALLAHGGDFERAAGELRREGYGDARPADCGANISAIVEACRPPVAARAPEVPDPGPMPDQLLRMPGFVGEVMDYCLATAPYPNPVMAFAGALSLQAFLAGRKVRDSGDNRTNLYLLGLAHSAAGKDWPRKVNTRIMHEVGLANCLGERFASGEGIQDALLQTPGMLFQTDEIDGMLQSINKAKDARYEAVMSTLLTMFSSSNSVFPVRPQGRQRGTRGDQSAQPGGLRHGDPEPLLRGALRADAHQRLLRPHDHSGGRAARHGTGAGDPGSAAGRAGDRQVVGGLSTGHRQPGELEPRARGDRAHGRGQAAARRDPRAGRGRIHRRRGQRRFGRNHGLGARERAGAQAGAVYAVSENHLAPRIGLAAVEWASAFVMHQTRRMLFMAAGHVAENPFHAECLKAVEKLRNVPGNELPHSVLLKRMKMDSRVSPCWWRRWSNRAISRS
jgi:hypothetical protein